MTEVAHAERAHSMLGASGADRWINCPPSARLTDTIEEKPSEYADEGTLAHELSENKLRSRLYLNDSKARGRLSAGLKVIHSNPFYCPEMENAVQEYVELVEERYMEAKARSSDAVLLLEERLDYSEWVPDGYGTGDVVLIADGLLEVIDLKYGKGIAVYAYNNPQPRLYGLGAWSGYNYLYDIKEIRMTIIQPRLDSVSSDTMAIEDLLEWAETVVRPAAELAFAGEGEFKAGSHCKWCKVKGSCKARADANMLALQHEFKDPALLSLEEVGSILFVAEQLKAWAGDVADYAFDQALKGNRVPQWKLVEGKSNRFITDKEAAKVAILAAGYKEEKFMKPQEMIAMGDLETKLLGKKKFKEILGGLVVKPPGKPVHVPETDRRSELNETYEAFANINLED